MAMNRRDLLGRLLAGLAAAPFVRPADLLTDHEPAQEMEPSRPSAVQARGSRLFINGQPVLHPLSISQEYRSDMFTFSAWDDDRLVKVIGNIVESLDFEAVYDTNDPGLNELKAAQKTGTPCSVCVVFSGAEHLEFQAIVSGGELSGSWTQAVTVRHTLGVLA